MAAPGGRGAGAGQPGIGGAALLGTSSNPTDAFVAKLDPAGSRLVYASYLGHSGTSQGNGIAMDAAGDAYVTGSTTASDFPTTAGSYQPSNPYGGGVFVTNLRGAGDALVYSTYLGPIGGTD